MNGSDPIYNFLYMDWVVAHLFFYCIFGSGLVALIIKHLRKLL